jgi:hypothetical protein
MAERARLFLEAEQDPVTCTSNRLLLGAGEDRDLSLRHGEFCAAKALGSRHALIYVPHGW